MANYGHQRLADFALDPGKVHLNHGSYGAVPREVAAAQDRWRATVERNPSGFFRSELQPLLRQAAERLAAAFGGQGQDWVFVDNATAGANAVMASLPLAEGDEILTTGEVYGAVRQTLRHHTTRCGARLVEVALPLPVPDDDAVVARIEARLGPRTRAVFLDHVTSRSGLILPVERVARLCRQAGIPIFIDGAHAPAMIDLDVAALGVDWYVGNGHKWLCAPRGCGFLWCRPEYQASLHPVVISHGYGQGYCAEFDWVGTRDPSPWLSVTAALDHHEALGGPALRQRNRALAYEMGRVLRDALGTEIAGPRSMLGAMAAVRLPWQDLAAAKRGDPLQVVLDRDFDILVSVNEIDAWHWVRVSAAVYNELEDCQVLVAALKDLSNGT